MRNNPSVTARNNKTFKRLLAVSALVLLAAPHQARAAEPVPGSSCSGTNANSFTNSGGPSNGGVNNLMFCNGGTNLWTGVINFQSTGNIGIANTGPGALLDIGKAGTTLGTLRLEGNTSGYVGLQPQAAAGSWTMSLPNSAGTSGYVLSTDGTGVTSWISNAGTASTALSSITAAAAAHTIANTNFAQTWNWNTLTTGTALTISSTSMTTGSLLSLTDTNTASSTGTVLKVNNSLNGGNAATFTGGNVGIGITSPSDVLEVKGAGNANGLEFAGQPVQIDTGSTTSDFAMYMGADKTNTVSYIQSVQVGTAPASLALNARGGNVGIGTMTPGAPLEIDSGDSGFAPLLQVINTSTGNQAYSQIGYFAGTSGEQWSTGVGVPTENAYGVPNKFFIYDSTAGAMRMVFDTNGNVMVGTTSAVSLFTVNGDIDLAASSYLNFGGADGSSGYGFRDSGGTMQRKNSGGSWATISTTSDQRLKRDIVSLPDRDGLAAIMKLRPVRFHWKDVEQDQTDGEQIGLIAQDVEKVYPTGDIAYNFGNVTMNLGNGKKETVDHARGLNYEKLVPPLIKALQEQQAEIENQHSAIEELRTDIAALKASSAKH